MARKFETPTRTEKEAARGKSALFAWIDTPLKEWFAEDCASRRMTIQDELMRILTTLKKHKDRKPNT